MKLSDSNKYWAAFGTKNQGGVFQLFLDYCATEPRTESELADFLVKESSPNECRWFNQRNSIRKLSVEVFKQFGKEITEKEASKAQLKALEARFKG
jgi:hypothetical protein